MRERDVMEALGRGEPLKHIALDLGISVSSVDTYRRRAQGKLSVTNRYDAIRRWRKWKRTTTS